MGKIKNNSLYLIITEKYGRGRTVLDIAGAAIAGGADIIQMREKEKDEEDLLKMGQELSSLCRKNKIPFIVNDDPYLAKKVKADGVHLGQEDAKLFPVESARKAVGESGIIGISTHSIEQFAKANDDDVDYIAFGPIFPTKTKDYHIGTDDMDDILKTAKKPVFFIGGINLSNIDELLKKGARNIAVIRGIMEAADIAGRTKELKERMRR